MIIVRQGGCDCPYGNFTCEVHGCVRKIRTREQLEQDSFAEAKKRGLIVDHLHQVTGRAENND